MAALITRAMRSSGLPDLRPIGLVVGGMLIVLAVAMIPSILADVVVAHPDQEAFIAAFVTCAFIGTLLVLVNRGTDVAELSTRQIFLLTTVTWLVTGLFAAIPFIYSDLDMSIADAVFEAMSGITTTGSTVIVGLDNAPPGILLWRSMLQWLGGVGIIVMGVAILPMLNVGGMQLFRSESSDRSDKILPRAAQIASAIGGLYLALTVACLVAYWLLGVPPFAAFTHAMTTIATGGYSPYDASIGYFKSASVEWAAILFMVISGLPFVLMVQAVNGRAGPLLRDVQVAWYLIVFLAVSAAITGWLEYIGHLGGLEAIRHAMFTTISVMTGTGYASTDYGQWGTFPIAILFFLKCVGGCTGSTTGGIKIFRFVVLYQVAKMQMYRLVQPNGVFRMTYNGRPISEATAISVMAFFFVFALTFAVTAAMLAFIGLDYLTAMSAAVTALANVGPGLGDIIGPAGNFSTLPEAAKWVLSIAMLLGRLELFTVLVLFTPLFWRR